MINIELVGTGLTTISTSILRRRRETQHMDTKYVGRQEDEALGARE
jgi:hypothetical protein